jgi:hypothetical protein
MSEPYTDEQLAYIRDAHEVLGKYDETVMRLVATIEQRDEAVRETEEMRGCAEREQLRCMDERDAAEATLAKARELASDGYAHVLRDFLLAAGEHSQDEGLGMSAANSEQETET